MLLVISPAKSLDYEAPAGISHYTIPECMQEAQALIAILARMTPADFAALTGISDQLAQLNVKRFAAWSTNPTTMNAKQSIFAFTGNVYVGLNAETLNKQQILFAQKHLRILSGLYGVLRPLDLMQPYRLEMGTRFHITKKIKTLYAFWGGKITNILNKQAQEIQGGPIINLASVEYFKSVKVSQLTTKVITPVFMDKKNNQYKVIGFYAKKARGLMCRYVIENQIKDPEALKAFYYSGYSFNEALSEGDKWVFARHKESFF